MYPMTGTVSATANVLYFQAAVVAGHIAGSFGPGTTAEPARLTQQRRRDPLSSTTLH
jgi:hypothetical protein